MFCLYYLLDSSIMSENSMSSYIANAYLGVILRLYSLVVNTQKFCVE